MELNHPSPKASGLQPEPLPLRFNDACELVLWIIPAQNVFYWVTSNQMVALTRLELASSSLKVRCSTPFKLQRRNWPPEQDSHL
jgi:hypothetical protein